MSDRLRQELEKAVDSAHLPPPDLAGVKQGGRRRSWRNRSAAMFSVGILSLLGWLGVSQIVDNRVTRSVLHVTPIPNYDFDARILDYKSAKDRVKVSYTQTWTTNEYPGYRDCTWRFYRSDGSLITSTTRRYTSTVRSVSQKDIFEVSKRPSSVKVGCGQQLDDGRWELISVEVVRNGDYPTSPSRWVVSFRIRWFGSGQPGTADCRYSVETNPNDARAVKGVRDRVVVDSAKKSLRVSSELPKAVVEKPSHPRVECQDYQR